MFAIIYNPVSGRCNAQELSAQIAQLLREREEEYCFFPTRMEGDGVNEAQLALDSGCTDIVCIGGDGTLSEVVARIAGQGVTL